MSNEKMGKIRYINYLLNTKKISCKELTLKFLNEINNLNKTLNAYILLTNDYALEVANVVDKKINKGEKISLLEGIPMTLKDNISTKNIVTTCCSKMLKDYIPIYDATVWNLLQNKNAVLLGKSNMDEFAMGSSCQTSVFGGTLNPYNTECVSGGSSGGTACAVASNIAVYGLGSDTGGSIRQPASFCGVVGLKPTYGAVSRYGLIAHASSFDQIGPISSCVEDTAIVYNYIAKKDCKDSTSKGKKNSITSKSLNADIKGLKIGVLNELVEQADSDTQNAIKKSIDCFELMGAQICYFNLPIINLALPVYYILACAEASSNLGRYDGIRFGYKTKQYEDSNEMILKTRSEGFGFEVKKRILLGTYVLSAGYYDEYYKKALNIKKKVTKEINELFNKCDVILAATAPTTAFEKTLCSKNKMNTFKSDICTVPANIAGLPAISLPCGFDNKGLPIGVQIIGNYFCEEKILNVAYKLEQELSLKFLNKGVLL